MTISKIFTEEETVFRHEWKYLCSEADMLLLESSLRCICRRDPHAGRDGKYRIRSVYFDSLDDECLEENINGFTDREKYRIRIYNSSDRLIKLERKLSLHDRKSKHACCISREQCDAVLQGRRVGGCSPDQGLLNQFLFEREKRKLIPKAIVEYVRTPYVYPIGNVRITFDRDITSISARQPDFFEETLPGRGIMQPGQHILEIKYDEVMPAAIIDCISKGISLRRCSFSKYTMCRKYAG